jgi:molybdate transport system substrate-binding protein
VLLVAWLPGAVFAAEVRVAVASSLRFVMPELAAAFEASSGVRVLPSYGASGNLMRQIVQGAPFELFLAADEFHAEELVRRGLTVGEGTVYAVGHLALVASPDSVLDPAGGLPALKRLLGEGRIERFAIANPEHAPYGVAAREVLRDAGLWETLAPRLVFGESVAQAMRFALSPDVAGGIVAWSLALSPELAERVVAERLPDSGHEPLRQRMVLVRGAGEAARSLYAFLRSPAAAGILRRYGFSVP